MLMPWFETRRKELANPPLLREQAFGEDVATSYFNYLGDRHVRDEAADEPTGSFVYRRICGVGRCWNKIADELGNPVSTYARLKQLALTTY